MNILLVEPDFPYPTKSKHKANEVHKNFVPIGLLKLGRYHKSLGDKVKLVRGKKTKEELKFTPDKILITSLFTYWSQYVWDTVAYYRNLFPKAKICIGGIYVTLHHKTKEFQRLAKQYRVQVNVGLNLKAEKYLPDYSLLNGKIEYHAIHAMRGCIRRCKFCGTWRLEPKMTYKNTKEIINEIKKIGKNKVIFYDNNFLANPNAKEILQNLPNLKINGKPVMFESQSGFDGRLLEKDPKLAFLLKKARFQNVRIAWDNSVNDAPSIKRQIDHLVKAGYPPKDISIFILYNFVVPYEGIIKKIEYCKRWGVQINDCRYRPLDSIVDNYKPYMSSQENGNYYIYKESGWSDAKIRDIRRRVREHNIGTRYGFPYSKKQEKWSTIHRLYKFFGLGRPPKFKQIEKSNLLKKRVKLMNMAKNIFEKKGKVLNTLISLKTILKGLPAKKINKKLEEFILKFSELKN